MNDFELIGNNIEKINISIENYRQLENLIAEKDKNMHEETRPAVVEDLKNEISDLTVRRDNLKDNINDSLREMESERDRLTTIINNLFMEKSKYGDNFNKQRMLDSALELRNKIIASLANWKSMGFYADYSQISKDEEHDRSNPGNGTTQDGSNSGNDTGNDTDGSNTGNTEEEGKNKIDEYLKALDKLTDRVNKMLNTMVMDTDLFTDVTEEIQGLCDEYKKIKDEGNDLLEEIKNSREIDPKLITKKLKELRSKLVQLKKMQIMNYNVGVKLVNERLDAIRNSGNIPEELANVTNLEEINIVIKQYDQNNYFELLKYDELVKLLNLTSKYTKKGGKGGTDGSTGGNDGGNDGGNGGNDNPTDDEIDNYEKLDARMKVIEERIAKLAEKIEKGNLTPEEIEECRNEITDLANLLNATRLVCAKLESCLNNMEYDDIMGRIEACEGDLYDLNSKLPKQDKAHSDLYDRANKFKEQVEFFHSIVVDPSLDEKQSESFIAALTTRCNEYRNSLAELRHEAEEKHNNHEISDDEFNLITASLDESEKIINECDARIKNFETLRELGFLDLLGNDIDSLERALDTLEGIVDSRNKPIKRDDRKSIDQMIKSIEAQIDLIGRNLEQHKDDDLDKYEAESKRLDDCKKRLEEIEKKYRSKCGLFVRATKSAKNFYKKHKKACLIGAGLAAIALLAGPVIIPAIMHGNLLIANKSVALRPLMTGINKILGGAINAKVVDTIISGVPAKVWQLANGNIISPSCATASLLKGIAISGIGSAALITPVVAGIKALIGKIRNKEQKNENNQSLKDKLKAQKEKLKGKIKDRKEKNDPQPDVPQVPEEEEESQGRGGRH